MAPQYGRPDGDITRTNVASGTYADIDETSPSDTDYLYGTNNTAVTYECSLSSLSSPGSGTKTVRYRVVKTNAGTPSETGSATSVTAYLVEGTSVLQTDTTRTLDGSWTSYEMVVTATVTDWSDVRLRFYSAASGGSVANRRSVGLSWAEFEIPAASDTLTAAGITTGSSVVGSPTIGQTHALTSAGITTGSPVLDAPTLQEAVETDDLIAAGIVTGSPVLDAPTFGQAHALTAAGIVTGLPILGAPTLGQEHALTAAGIATGSPVLDAPTFGQEHALTAVEITTGSPVLDAPTLYEAAGVDNLTAAGITTGSPVLDAPTVSQVHVLTSARITTQTPDIGLPAINQTHVLASAGITTSSPILGAPVLSEVLPDVDNLYATDIVTGSFEVGSPVIGQVHVLTSTWITTGSSEVGSPVIGQIHTLIANGVETLSSVLGAPELATFSTDELVANNITFGIPELGSPILEAFVGEPPSPDRISLMYTESRVSYRAGSRMSYVSSERRNL